MADARHSIEMGERFPYDGGEAFWNDRRPTPPPAKDWAHKAARGVLANLSDRAGIKHAVEDVDHEVRAELTESLAGIIRLAHEGAA